MAKKRVAKKRKSRKVYMAEYRRKLKEANPVLYYKRMREQMRKWRLKNKKSLLKFSDNIVLFDEYWNIYYGEDIDNADVVSLYFDCPEGISEDEMYERKRLRMLKCSTCDDNNDFVYCDMNMKSVISVDDCVRIDISENWWN